MSRKRIAKADDPLLRPCTACGARKGEGCRTNVKDSKLVSRATRLVHADRLEGATNA